LFENEYRYRANITAETALEKHALPEDDFQHLKDTEYVLKPFVVAQKAYLSNSSVCSHDP